MFSPRSKHKRVNKDKEPGVHYGGQDRQQSSDEPVPKCLQHNWDNCQRRAGHAWQQSTLMIWKSGKQRAPAPSLHMRIKGLSKFSTPAPGVYDPLVSLTYYLYFWHVCQQKGEKKTKSGSASYSFGLRPDRGRKEGPAPNAYSVETHKLGWEFYFSVLLMFSSPSYQDWWSCFLTSTKDEGGKGVCDTSAKYLRHEKAWGCQSQGSCLLPSWKVLNPFHSLAFWHLEEPNFLLCISS